MGLTAMVKHGGTAVAEGWQELRSLGVQARHLFELRRALRWRDLRSGHWFDHLMALYVRHYELEVPRPAEPPSERERTRQAESLIRRAALEAALLGGGTASFSTGATLLTAETEGLAGLVALPLAGLGMGGEMVMRALLHLGMTCRVADTYGVRFSASDPGELTRLYALAFGTEEHDDVDDPGRGLIERVIHLQDHEGGAIGSSLLSETLVKNVIPFVGVAASALQSWWLTEKVGRVVARYARYRRVVDAALAELLERDPDAVAIAVEGIWFVMIAAGPLAPERAALLAQLTHRRPAELQAELVARFVRDDQPWLVRLRAIRPEAREPLLRVLERAAVTDGRLGEPQLLVLRRAAAALGEALDEQKVRGLAEEYRAAG
jgi:hypothetical protein